ncbi:hypothetical protein O3M35_001145 [Rhynocoris fuscipes]|uniref:FERM, RhoGEF and pleckstrin domain-containing protein 2 n=1 Tax=Rhynocoris fuscipes TaxID=488301 RepID=A0AAW1DP53_9HEMI
MTVLIFVSGIYIIFRHALIYFPIFFYASAFFFLFNLLLLNYRFFFTVAVVEIDEKTGPNSPKFSSPLANSSPKHKNNNVTIAVHPNSPKVNGIPNSMNGEHTSPELSPLKTLKEDSIKAVSMSDTLDGEVKKKRYSSDKAYFIAKEILMTERTYRKDLEVINLWLRDEFSKNDAPSITHLLNIIDPLHDAHCILLKEVELRLATWENRGANHHRISDILLKAVSNLQFYQDYLEQHQSVLEQLSKDLGDDSFEQIYTSFEKNKICYLPLTLFILKPIQRLLHYIQLIDRLMNFYGQEHPEYDDCEAAKLKLLDCTKNIHEILQYSENYVQLVELSRDLSGFDGSLTEGGRQFIRQGCLSKFSQRKGFQQRMFFLLSDMMLYSNLCGQTFKVHGQMPTNSLTVQEREDNPTPNSFIIYSGTRAITVSASSQEEKDKWLEDIARAIDDNKNNISNNETSLVSLKCSSSSDDVNEKCAEETVRATPQRSNTTVHVCWHRNTSISLNDQIRAAQNQLSGYLLRKFKNSNGWQKLWVVFTNFCLFFYKTFQDDAPLASLPLLGYCVTTPTEKDNINKDYVFKLQFKNHVYFFRAESEYTFGRWMEVIGSATQHSGRIRLFSRKESALEYKIS